MKRNCFGQVISGRKVFLDESPMFSSPGGAVQYKHFQSIANEIDQKKIMEVDYDDR